MRWADYWKDSVLALKEMNVSICNPTNAQILPFPYIEFINSCFDILNFCVTMSQMKTYTFPGVLHFLQTEWRRFDRQRNEWDIEKEELLVID
jgi:hypothetical protein